MNLSAPFLHSHFSENDQMTEKHLDFSYTCPCCGELKTGLPVLGFSTPLGLPSSSDEEKDDLGDMRDDVYVDRGTSDRFVRCVMSMTIIGLSTALEWSVWVSLSETNFTRYRDSYASGMQARLGPMFGWLCSWSPDYPGDGLVKCRVHPRDGRLRPLIEIEPTDHPLSQDMQNGITLDRAIMLATPWLEILHAK